MQDEKLCSLTQVRKIRIKTQPTFFSKIPQFFIPIFHFYVSKQRKNKARKSAVVTALKFCYTFTFRKQKGFFAHEKKNKAN